MAGARPGRSRLSGRRPTPGRPRRMSPPPPAPPTTHLPAPERRALREVARTGEAEASVPWSLRVAAAWSWRLLLVAAGIIGIGAVLMRFSEVTIPLAIALLLTALLRPVITRLQKWGLPRGLAVAVGELGGLLLVGGVITLIGWQIASNWDDLVRQANAGYQRLLGWLSSGPLHIPTEQLTTWGTQIADWARRSPSLLAGYAARAGTSLGAFLAGMAIALFSLFFMLYDGRAMTRAGLGLLDPDDRPRTLRALHRGWDSLEAYVRATIVVAAADALPLFLLALILRVPMAAALAALVFLGAFVPIVGAFTAGSVAVLVALVTGGWLKALIMLIGIVVIQQVEGHVLQPLLMGRMVAIHPLGVLIAIALGITLGGIVGALIAVPVLAFAKAFVNGWRHHHDEGVDPAHAAPSASSP
ncbi:AI-2E family transporter [Aestuariimicrobium ganziense]|uniref:AI-2E family transporter n=1 Tax=Aestuariimicrobium ganziense TaxID=2773677 RepID=UPI0019446536|nr:AI-2E family transporter [Aestuariimicrobium ganziense]